MSKPTAEVEQRYRKLVREASHLTLASASERGEPEAAILAFACAPAECLYFYTLNDSRKYRNLSVNQRVALTLYHPPEYAQLNGRVEELAGDEAERAKRAIIERSSGDREEYHTDSRCRYFRFQPERICLRLDEGFPATYEEWNPFSGEEPRVRKL